METSFAYIRTRVYNDLPCSVNSQNPLTQRKANTKRLTSLDFNKGIQQCCRPQLKTFTDK